MKQKVDCDVRFYNVIEATERSKAIESMEASLNENDQSTRKVVCIMGGDGSLSTTIKFLRTTSKVIDLALQRGKLSFCMLPYGTGNDGAQAFGWGETPSDEMWQTDLEVLMVDIITATTEPLTLWNCVIEGEVYDPHGKKLDNTILLCYYFNMGVDADIGI